MPNSSQIILMEVKKIAQPNQSTWGFPKIRGTFLGVPITRIVVFGGLYWDSLRLTFSSLRVGALSATAGPRAKATPTKGCFLQIFHACMQLKLFASFSRGPLALQDL